MIKDFFKEHFWLISSIALGTSAFVIAIIFISLSSLNERRFVDRNFENDQRFFVENEERFIHQGEEWISNQFQEIGANAEREQDQKEKEYQEVEEESVEQTIARFTAFESCVGCTIKNVSIGEHVEYKYYGDLWSTAWADNDHVYMMFGDGTGRTGCLPTVDGVLPGEGIDPWPGVRKKNGCFEISKFGEEDGDWPCDTFDCNRCYENLCKATPAGVIELKGNPDNFLSCTGDEQCLVAKDVPFGDERVLRGIDKPSSMIAVGKRIYAGMHWPPGIAEEGYVAYSDDYARTWTKVSGTPWGKDSKFRVVMYVQMGRANELNTDGFVYALGTPHEVAGNKEQEVRLARVPEDKIANYGAYEYFVGYQSDGSPTWSNKEKDSIPLDTITTAGQGTATYHHGTNKYLFLSGFRSIELNDEGEPEGKGALFEADNPWGPWREVARFPMITQPSFIQKGSTQNSIFFNGSGGTFFNGLVVAEMRFEL